MTSPTEKPDAGGPNAPGVPDAKAQMGRALPLIIFLAVVLSVLPQFFYSPDADVRIRCLAFGMLLASVGLALVGLQRLLKLFVERLGERRREDAP